ncbi:PDZ domain-containing protein, partial [Arthrospira platensis SPKY1]|nr:PDZ domain-containing protein [Arthrospira platensis SPKY1]
DTLYRAWISRVSINDTLELPPASVDFSGPKNHRIGNAFWRQFTLTVDWQARQLHLVPVDLASLGDFHSFGFRPVFRDGQLQAGFVWEDSPADRQGLKPGDRILFMNGMDCINFSEQQYCRLWLDDQLERWEKLDLFVEQDG